MAITIVENPAQGVPDCHTRLDRGSPRAAGPSGPCALREKHITEPVHDVMHAKHFSQYAARHQAGVRRGSRVNLSLRVLRNECPVVVRVQRSPTNKQAGTAALDAYRSHRDATSF